MKISTKKEKGYILPGEVRKILSPINNDAKKIEEITFDVSKMSWGHILLLISTYDQIVHENSYIKKILIADDDIISRDIIRNNIAEFCNKYDKLVDIKEVESAEEAIKILEDEQFDLLLLDINFGTGMLSGLDALRIIREKECASGISSVDGDMIQTSPDSIRIVLISSTISKENYAFAMQYGAQFIPKLDSAKPYIDSLLKTIL